MIDSIATLQPVLRSRAGRHEKNAFRDLSNKGHGWLKTILGFLIALVFILSAQELWAIDPVRPGEKVEVFFLNEWRAAEVLQFDKKQVRVRINFVGDPERVLPLNQVRFPFGQSEWRTWSDATGKFKLTARLIDTTDTSVTLLGTDGKRKTIAIDKLSPSSQKAMEKYAKVKQEINDTSLVRVGDEIEYLYLNTWCMGKVEGIRPEGIHISFYDKVFRKDSTATAKISELRFPNGGGPWADWKDITGKHTLRARYLSHDESNVYLLRDGNKRVSIERSKLDEAIQSELQRRPVLAQRPNHQDFDTSAVDLDNLPNWMFLSETEAPEFTSARQLNSQPVDQPRTLKSGFFTIDLPSKSFPKDKSSPHPKPEDAIPDGLIHEALVQKVDSAMTRSTSPKNSVHYEVSLIPTDEPTLFLLIAQPSRYTEFDALTIYWLDLNDQNLTRGPSFFDGETVITYSSKHARLMTTEGTKSFNNPSSFCIYDLPPKKQSIKPLARWNIQDATYVGFTKITGNFLPENRVAIGNGSKLLLLGLRGKAIGRSLPHVLKFSEAFT